VIARSAKLRGQKGEGEKTLSRRTDKGGVRRSEVSIATLPGGEKDFLGSVLQHVLSSHGKSQRLSPKLLGEKRERKQNDKSSPSGLNSVAGRQMRSGRAGEKGGL